MDLFGNRRRWVRRRQLAKECSEIHRTPDWQPQYDAHAVRPSPGWPQTSRRNLAAEFAAGAASAKYTAQCKVVSTRSPIGPFRPPPARGTCGFSREVGHGFCYISQSGWRRRKRRRMSKKPRVETDRSTGGPMVTRAPFLKTRYSGYHHRHVPAEDTELTHVGPEHAVRRILRRFWQPVCYSDDLRDLPLGLRILGEDLVAFRDEQRRGRPAGIALPASRHVARIRAGRRPRGSAAAITAGCSASTARSWRPRASRRQHAKGPAVSRRLSDP